MDGLDVTARFESVSALPAEEIGSGPVRVVETPATLGELDLLPMIVNRMKRVAYRVAPGSGLSVIPASSTPMLMRPVFDDPRAAAPEATLGGMVMRICTAGASGREYVPPTVLAEKRLTFAQARDFAIANLRSRKAPAFERLGVDVWQSAWRNGYDAALLWDPRGFDALGLYEHTRVLVLAAHVVLVADARNPAALAQMVELALDKYDPASMFAPYMFAPTGEAGAPLLTAGPPWMRVALPPGHAAQRSYESLLRRWRLAAYADQHDALEEEVGGMFRIATASLIHVDNEQGRHVEAVLTRVTRKMPTLLPRADYIAFADPLRQIGKVVAWNDFQRVAGAFERWPGFPARYVLKAFPSEAMLSTLPTPIM